MDLFWAQYFLNCFLKFQVFYFSHEFLFYWNFSEKLHFHTISCISIVFRRRKIIRDPKTLFFIEEMKNVKKGCFLVLIILFSEKLHNTKLFNFHQLILCLFYSWRRSFELFISCSMISGFISAILTSCFRIFILGFIHSYFGTVPEV